MYVRPAMQVQSTYVRRYVAGAYVKHMHRSRHLSAYKNVRFVGYLKDCDAPQYDEHMKEVDRAKQRLKRQRRAGSSAQSSAWTSWAAPEAPSGWEIH